MLTSVFHMREYLFPKKEDKSLNINPPVIEHLDNKLKVITFREDQISSGGGVDDKH